MKTRLAFMGLLLICLMAGCREKKFSVEFSLDRDVETSYRMLYYASDARGGRWIESAAPVHLGKYIFDGPAINPAIVYIFRTNSSMPETFFYAERGDKIEITGNSSDPYEWKFKGNSITERLSEWQSANLTALKTGSPEAVNKAVAAYIEKNPKSEINPLLLLCRYDRALDPEGFVKLWNLMASGLRKKDYAPLTAMADIANPAPFAFDDKGMAVYLPGNNKIKTLSMRVYGKGKQTLRLMKGQSAIIYFWHLHDPERGTILDSLRSLSKQYPDSTRILMAAICLDYDSLRWNNNVRFDSVPRLRNGWLPGGLAEPEALRLGIGAYRTLLVLDSEGRPVYKGDSIAAAVRKLKNIK